MKLIFITRTFKGQIKRFRQTVQEADIVLDVKDFVVNGLRHGDTHLRSQEVCSLTMEMVKLRFYIRNTHFRYLLAVIGDREYMPIIMDRKAGLYGQNLSFKANKRTREAIDRAIVAAVDDFLAYSADATRASVYRVE